jgi:predicted component of type VI protein secretion system
MRRFTAVVFSALMCGLLVPAQDAPDPEQRAEALRVRLRGLADREAELQAKAQRIEEDLKPENIQRSIALIGTTRPGELREQRRLQLEKEKAAVQAQLEEVAASRSRLEAAVAEAEEDADRRRMNAATAPPEAAAGDTSTAPAASARPQEVKRSGQRRRRGRARRRVPPKASKARSMRP